MDYNSDAHRYNSSSAVFGSLLKELAYQFECQVTENRSLREENDRLKFVGVPRADVEGIRDDQARITEEANAAVLKEEESLPGDDYSSALFIDKSTLLTEEANMTVPILDEDIESESDLKQNRIRRISSVENYRQISFLTDDQTVFVDSRQTVEAVGLPLRLSWSARPESIEQRDSIHNEASRKAVDDGEVSRSSEGEPKFRPGGGSVHSNSDIDTEVGLFSRYIQPITNSESHGVEDEDAQAPGPVNRLRTLGASALANISLNDPALRESSLMLTPLGRKRLSWDLLWTVALVTECFFTPIDLIYIDSNATPVWLNVLSRITLAVFCLDIVLNFFTGYIRGGSEILVPRMVIKRYLRFWFWFDVIVTVPWDEVISYDGAEGSGTARASKALRAQKLFKLLRLFRLSKTVKTVKQKKERDKVNKLIHGHTRSDMIKSWVSETLKPLKPLSTPLQMVCLILFMSHLHGAVWAWLREDWAPTDDIELAFKRYLESLWWAFSTYNFGSPTGDSIVLGPSLWILDLVILSERLALLMFAAVYVVFKAMVMREDDASHSLRSHYAMEYLKRHNVSIKTQVQMLFSVNETGENRKSLMHFERLLEDGIPTNLQIGLRKELWETRLRSLGLIDIVHEWVPSIILEMCQLVGEETFASRVVLFKKGDAGGVSYQIINGAMLVTKTRTDAGVDYIKDMWVGERALINPGLRRSETSISKQVSSLMRVPAKEFQALLQSYHMLERYQQYCSAELWKGLCGRCGILGDHFADECPSLDASNLTRRTPPKARLRSIFSRSSSRINKALEEAPRKYTFDRALKLYLTRHKLMRLSPVLEQLGIDNIDLMQEHRASIISESKQNPATMLSWAEEELLTKESVQEFQDNLIKRTMTMLKEKVDAGQHYMFLSHYKAEAGTEATLMRAEFERLIMEDEGHPARPLDAPIFLDSEDLSDLRDLVKSVIKSHNLVIMLTKGILTRPWCIVEIATAVKYDVVLVPVMISKPTAETFQFPDEQFYKDMANGVILGKSGTETVLQEGFDMEFVCHAIRRVFAHIALPYSPHKSQAIRIAELKKILKQCSVRDVSSTAAKKVSM